MALLEGKSSVVTGSGRGLGRAYAMAMAREGARVVVNDIDLEEAERTVVDIKAEGGSAVANGDNIADWAGAKRLVDQCASDWGSIDVLVNNAGVHHFNPYSEESEEDIDFTLAVNVKGTLNTARHALGYMLPQRRGSIINVTSGAQSGIAGQAVYGASKAAVAGFTYALALEVASSGIRVNAISPLAHTSMAERAIARGYQVRAMWPPENLGPVAVFLASDEASYITGQVVRLEGNALSVVSQPKPAGIVVIPGGWTLDDIRSNFRETLGRHLQGVGIRAERYQYYDGVGGG